MGAEANGLPITTADIMFWAGCVLGLVAAVCHYMALSASSTSDAMVDTPTSPAGSIREPGYYEVKGTIGCGDPLTHPETGRKLVQYVFRIIDVWEETYKYKGQTRTRRWEETVEEERRQAPFWIEDKSGRIEVDPRVAELDCEVLMSRRLEAATGASAAAYGLRRVGDKRRLERRKEMVGLEVDQWVYCIGPVVDAAGNLVFQGKDEEGRPFLLSSRSEEDQISSFGNISRIYNVAAILAGVLAALCALGYWIEQRGL